VLMPLAWMRCHNGLEELVIASPPTAIGPRAGLPQDTLRLS
jgi:hypothetical protein